jgi:nucleoside-diphosphate-sugar epimerase
LHAEIDGVHAMETLTLGTPARIEGIALRFGLYYGPGAGTEVMARMLKRSLLPLPGGGRGVWPLIYIEDAAEALALAVTHGRPGEIYNVVDDEPVRLSEFVAEIARLTGARQPWSVPVPLARLGASYFTQVATTSLRVSNEKAKAELGWSPRHRTYREGLAAWAATTAQAVGQPELPRSDA